jgi:hypothetical protein
MSGDGSGPRRYLTETERAVRASIVGFLLGVVLRLIARR